MYLLEALVAEMDFYRAAAVRDLRHALRCSTRPALYSWISSLGSIDRQDHQLCALLRELFVGPNPIRLDPSWVSANVQELASTIYHDRSFYRMPNPG
jgi:hypothetical protein